MNNEINLWQWLANMILGLFFLMTAWLSRRQISRVDDLEKRINIIDKVSISREELDRHLNAIDNRIESLTNYIRSEFNRLYDKIDNGKE